MKTAMVMLLAVIFMASGACSASSDIGVVVGVAFSKVQTISEDNIYSEKVVFEDGKAVWQAYSNTHFAFYNEEALKKLVQSSDSAKVFLAPFEEGVAPSFGNLYLVLRNAFGNNVTEVYGLDAEAFYVWPVKFPTEGVKLKDSGGIIYYKGIAPLGDSAIKNIKQNGRRITKNFFASLKARK